MPSSAAIPAFIPARRRGSLLVTSIPPQVVAQWERQLHLYFRTWSFILQGGGGGGEAEEKNKWADAYAFVTVLYSCMGYTKTGPQKELPVNIRGHSSSDLHTKWAPLFLRAASPPITCIIHPGGCLWKPTVMLRLSVHLAAFKH